MHGADPMACGCSRCEPPAEDELDGSGPSRGHPVSAHVRWIQRALNRVAGAGLTEDGKLGLRTRGAVLLFQRRQGLPADGKVGPRTEAALVRAGAPPPPDGVPAAPTPLAPGSGRCRLDTRVAEVTLYQSIPLGVPDVPNETAIYLPPGLRRTPRVDLIVYLHGFERNRQGEIICGQARTIDEYLRGRHFPLREILRDSGKNAILVAPKLGTHSEPGTLVRPGAFTAFVDKVLQALATCGAWSKPPGLGRLVLAAHSGGGAPLGRITTINGELLEPLKEVWMFDALYGAVVPHWERFLHARPDLVARFAFTTNGGTLANHTALSEKVKRPNVEIRLTRAPNHCWVPHHEMKEWLARSLLDNR
jgi:peptidoglycan hydrolase-like protein with peptidoglycan-binding domain